MIKGSIEERMVHEDYIHSLKDTIRFPFWSIYQDSQKIIRYYWIKKARRIETLPLMRFRYFI